MPFPAPIALVSRLVNSDLARELGSGGRLASRLPPSPSPIAFERGLERAPEEQPKPASPEVNSLAALRQAWLVGREAWLR